MSQEQEFSDFQIDINLEATPAWDGEQAPLPDPGEYHLLVKNLEQKPGNKAPMIAVTFEIVGRVQDDGSVVEAAGKVWQNYSLSDKAQGRLKALMVACRTELTRIVGSQFLGQTIRATIVHNEGQAKVDHNGDTLPSRMFANVQNERPLEEAAPQQTAPTPPVMNGAKKPAAAAAKTTAPRRA